MNNNQWNKAKVPFFLEVEYYDEVNPDTESKLMRSLLINEDILPGLRVNQMFANHVDKNALISNEIKNDLMHLQEEFEKFKNKYIKISDDRSNNFLDNKNDHTDYIKETTKNNNQYKIDNTTERYKAYDDPTNFPA